ncbi:MAG: hypothetical protein P8103_17280 [Candidatus Thiodiazotropha sp.]
MNFKNNLHKPVPVLSQIIFLRIPLHKLYHIDDVSAFSGLADEEIESLRGEYTELELNEIIHSVKWAIENKDYDFSSLLPNLRQSNEEIYKYLYKLGRSLEDLVLRDAIGPATIIGVDPDDL